MSVHELSFLIMAIHTGAASNKRVGKRKSAEGRPLSKRARKHFKRLAEDQQDDEHLYEKKQRAIEGGSQEDEEQKAQEAEKNAPPKAPQQPQQEASVAKKKPDKQRITGFMALADL